LFVVIHHHHELNSLYISICEIARHAKILNRSFSSLPGILFEL